MTKIDQKIDEKADVWMPLYIGDYLAATQRLTTEQHGAYLLLLIDYWRNGPPPFDDAVLAQITHLKLSAWRKMKPVIIGFFKLDDGKLIHSRVEAERGKAIFHQARRSQKAKAAADARWAKDGDASGNAQAMPQAMLGACPPPSPSLTNVRGGQPPGDQVKNLFEAGVGLLTKTGTTPSTARSLIGKWRKAQSDEIVAAAIADATRLEISDPKAWITARLAKAANDSSDFYASIDRTFGAAQQGR